MKRDFYSVSERFDKVFALLSEETNFIGCYSFVDEHPCTIFELSDISFFQMKKLLALKVHFTIFGEELSRSSVRRFNVVQIWFAV